MPRTRGTNPDPKNPAREIGSYNQSLTFPASSGAGRVTTNRTYVLEANYQTGNQALYATNVFGGRGSPVATKSPNGRWQVTGVTSNPLERLQLLVSLNRGNFGRTLNNELQTVATRDLGSNQFDRIFNPIVARNPETGSPSGGTNPPAGSRTDGSTPSTTPEEQKALIDKISSAIQARTKYNSELLKYPEKYEGNDYLTITMIRYVPDTNLSIGPVAGAPEGESKTVSLGGLGALRPSERFGKNNEKKVTLATIDLPIPSNLLDGNLATWGNGDLNPFQAYGVGAFTRLMTSGGDILNQIGREGSTAANAVKGNADGIKTVALNSIISNILRQNPKELLSRSTGAVINPNQELLFLGPGLRTFSFSFKMTPRSEKEATSVRKIIRTLKQGMAVKRAVGGLFLAAPNVFELEFKYVPPQQNEDGSFDRGVTAVRHPYLPVLKVCALQNVSVNYMPDGSYMTYGDGSMVSYDMTLTFAELEPIFDTDYSELDKDTDKFIGY